MAAPGPHSAFFYGTLMSPAVLHRVTGAPRETASSKPFYTTQAAILSAHRRRHVRRADYPAVTPAKADDSVRGTYVTGLRDSDVFRLDRFEGDEYERRNVRVRLLPAGSSPLSNTDGQQKIASDSSEWGEANWVDTQTYIWTAPEAHLDPQEWDFDEFLKTKLWRWSGNSPEFAESDAVATADEAGEEGVDGTRGRQFFDGDKEEAKQFASLPAHQGDGGLSQQA